MKNLWNNLMKGVNPDDEDQYNDVFDDDEIYGDPSGGSIGDLGDFMVSSGYQPSPYGNQIQQNQNQSQQNYQGQGGYSQQPAQPVYTPPQPQANSSGITVSGGSNLSVELKVVKPEDYQDVTQIADHLINRKTVILNLEETNKETARRLLDFLNGVAYTIQGQVERVADRTFVITPSNIGITSDQLKEDVRKAGRADNPALY